MGTAPPPEAAASAARRVFGPRYGIVARCDPVVGDGLQGLSLVVAWGPRQMPGWSMWSRPEGAGIATDPAAARLAAIAEVVEQYCSLAPPDPSRLVRASWSALGSAAAQPGSFAGLSLRQRRHAPGLVPLTEGRTVDWCWAFSLTENRPRLVPAARVYSCLGASPPNDFLPELLSTGLACHLWPAQAVMHGLCEVLERDALAVAWHSRLPMVALHVNGTPVEALLAGPVRASGAEFQVLQVPTDAPFPVVVAVMIRRDQEQPREPGEPPEPHAVLGAACRPDPVDAVRKAVLEGCQVLSWLRRAQPARPTVVRAMADHAALFATADGARLLRRHLVVAPGWRHLSQVAGGTGSTLTDLRGAIEALARRCHEVLVCELTTADVATAGFRVLRVLVPGLLDISADPRFAALRSARLYDLPVRLGLRASPLPEHRLNRLPVPLA